MSEEGRFTLQLEQLEDYQIKVLFDLPKAPDLLMDEPPPLGARAGPNASRLLAAATGNCLSASLLFCLTKAMDQVPDHCIRTQVTCIMVRDQKRRLRVGRLEVQLHLAGTLLESPKLKRCLTLFEDFCVVSASIRQGIPIQVEVLDPEGTLLHHSE